MDPGGHANPASHSPHKAVPGGPYIPAGHDDAATTRIHIKPRPQRTNAIAASLAKHHVRRPNLLTKTVKFDAVVNAPLLSVTVSDTFTPRMPAS